ncbi:MAG: hypothetical protein LH481_11655 [Burkholderiales bacterium]|nr:hypothetical protein [Burkholderiales bacterium]
MTKSITISAFAVVAGLLTVVGASSNVGAQINPIVMPVSGPMSKQSMSRLLLTDAARIGNRVVAVGDRGYIVYSDSNGESWQRATTPPNTPLLTAVTFIDAKTGWAVGHDSMILTSTDQGTSWTKAFSAPDDQKPLMDITFVDANTGFAVGAYGAFYATTDGGKTWTSRKLFEGVKEAPKAAAAPKKGKYESVGSSKDADTDAGAKGGEDDKHLNAIIKLGENKLFVAGEAGMLAKSDDGGKTWSKIASPYKGSFFGAIQAQNGAVLIYGLRGRIYRSTDAALANWKQIDNKSVASLMGGTRLPDGTLVLAGLSGTVLLSRDNGETFSPLPSGSTKALAASLLGAPSALLLIGESGVREVLLSAATSANAAPAAPPSK